MLPNNWTKIINEAGVFFDKNPFQWCHKLALRIIGSHAACNKTRLSCYVNEWHCKEQSRAEWLSCHLSFEWHNSIASAEYVIAEQKYLSLCNTSNTNFLWLQLLINFASTRRPQILWRTRSRRRGMPVLAGHEGPGPAIFDLICCEPC